MVRNPSDNAFYAFPPTTQLFGSTASVLHYNVLSRAIVKILIRVFAIPDIGYYDDYGFLAPSPLADHAVRVVRRVCSLLGIELKDDKCRIAGQNNFLGLTSTFPCRDNNFTLTICLAPDKSLKWKRVLGHIFTQRRVTRAVLESVIGRLGFAQSAVFSRFARCMLQPLYAELYSLPFYTVVHGKTLGTFKWRSEALSMLPPRVVSKRVRFPGFLLYTDASFENGSGMLAAVLFDLAKPSTNDDRAIDTAISGPTTPQMIGMFRQTSTIFGLGLLALTMSLYQLRYKLASRPVIVFVGNNAALGSIAKGQTSGQTPHSYISGMWMLTAPLSISLWFGRVPSALNIADLPTRYKIPGYPIINSSGFTPPQRMIRIYAPYFHPRVC